MLLKRVLLLSALWLFLWNGPAFCQNWQTDHYTGLNGLPSSAVYDIVQDHQGSIWVATRSGIARHDGVDWKTFTVRDGLQRLSYNCLAVDAGGRIWALADPAQGSLLEVSIYDGFQWKHLENIAIVNPGKHSISAFQLVERPDGTELLIGSRRHGVFRRTTDGWSRITMEQGLLSNEVNGIAVLDQKCYVATAKGLSVIDASGAVDNMLNERSAFPTRDIKGIAVEETEKYPDTTLEHPRIWMFGDGYLGFFDEENPKAVYRQTDITFGDAGPQVLLLPDYRTGMYVGNRYEVFYSNHKTRRTETVTSRNGLVSEGANCMMIDFEKNIWISCLRGATRIAGRWFSNYRMQHGLMEDEVTAIVEFEPGKFLLGHNRGLTFWDERGFTKIPFEGKIGGSHALCRVLDIKTDSQKNIWAALSNTGLARVRRNGDIKWYGRAHGLPQSGALSLWVGAADDVWVGSSYGMYRKEGDRFVHVTEGFPGITPRKIYGKAGEMTHLGGYSSGLYVREKDRWVRYTVPGNTKADDIYSIMEDSRGRLFTGTLDGLFLFKDGEVRRFSENGFQLTRPVYFIQEDHKHILWFGTDTGVVRWDGRRAITYSIPEGLVGQETNRAAGVVDNSGRLWIGTNRGLSIYDAAFDDLSSWSPPPKLRLSHLEVDEEIFQLDRPLTLDYKKNTLEFHFRGISFKDESAIRFSHKLVGYDRDWLKEHYPYQQKIRYSRVQPGAYRFHIKARNALGVWSDVVSSTEIIIKAPFYNTWWFFIILLSAVGLLFYSVFNFILTRRHAALLEKQVEERTGQLQATEKRYRDLFEDSRDMVFSGYIDGKFIDINPAGVKLLGFETREEALASDIRSSIYYSDKVRVKFFKEIEEKGFVKEFEVEVQRTDGEKRIALISATPIPADGTGLGGIRGIVRDITEKTRLEQQLAQAQKMEALGTLAGGIAHDFNNILAVITGYLDLSMDELPEESIDIRANLDQVMLAAGRAKELVYQILTFSRRSIRRKKSLQVSLVVMEALKLMRSSLPSTIDIRRDLAADAVYVQADPTQIHQVVMNLCTNAGHAMKESGGVLTVGLHEIFLDEDTVNAYEDIQPGRFLKLSVTDTGHGIPPKVLKRIFEPYFTTKKKGEGTGMGLAMIHGIVKAHSGDISVYSEPGKGTTFNVFLPVSTAGRAAGANITQSVPRGGLEHILFVDDENLLVEISRQMLGKLGYEVTAKNSSMEALEVFRESPGDFDLVITDLTMPSVTGIQLATEVRSMRPDIPIIICTGFSEAISPAEVKALNIQRLLVKPVNKSIMAKAIRAALREK